MEPPRNYMRLNLSFAVRMIFVAATIIIAGAVALIFLGSGVGVTGILSSDIPDGDFYRVLENAGYSDVHKLPYSFSSGCKDDDTYNSGFAAKNAKGAVVTGVVCSDGQALTIRYY